MKQTFILLLFTLTTNSLSACLSASQNRLFPLGLSSKGLLVVETHLQRTEYYDKEKKTEKMEKAWFGKSFFKIYDNNYKEVYSAIIDTIKLFQEYRYDSIINKTFMKGLDLAKAYPGFVAAKPTSITFCDYQPACSKAKLLFDTINNKVSIQLSNKIKYDVKVLFDSTSIASNLFDNYADFDGAALSAKLFSGRLYISSVREFQVGNKKLIIVHLGSGQIFESAEGPPRKEYKAKFTFTDINESVFKEPVLHHGHGCDFFIWE
jgi:hypothetical protein